MIHVFFWMTQLNIYMSARVNPVKNKLPHTIGGVYFSILGMSGYMM